MSELRQKLVQAKEMGLIEFGNIDALCHFLDSQTEEGHVQGSFDLFHVLWLVGVLLLLFALSLIGEWAHEEFEDFGLLVFFGLLTIGFFTLSIVSERQKIKFLSAIMAALVVITLPLTAISLGQVIGLEDDTVDSLGIAAVILVSSVTIYVRRFPVLVLVLYGGVMWGLDHWFGFDLESEIFWIYAGFITIFMSWGLNLKTQMNFTFWLNKIAAPGLAYGTSLFVDIDSDEVLISANFLWISLGVLFLAVYLRYPTFVMTGALGIVTYFNLLFLNAYDGNLMPALLLTVQAGLVMFLGARLYNNREKLDRVITDNLPKSFLKFRPTPLKEPLSYGL